MLNEGQMTLSVLHDLALLYLGLAHGADGSLDPAETREIALKLREWQPDKDPKLIDHVLRDATLTYLNGTTPERLEEVVISLKDVLNQNVRREILHDLSDIAYADGTLKAGESRFVESLARVWDVDADGELK
jgi:uncharacterized tellurite resistance protein B-like protein